MKNKIEAASLIPQEWRPAEKYIATCARCACEVLKRNAVGIYRLRRGNNMALLLHFCPACYVIFLDDYGIGE